MLGHIEFDLAGLVAIKDARLLEPRQVGLLFCNAVLHVDVQPSTDPELQALEPCRFLGLYLGTVDALGC